jgi:hypothetical protein
MTEFGTKKCVSVNQIVQTVSTHCVEHGLPWVLAVLLIEYLLHKYG